MPLLNTDRWKGKHEGISAAGTPLKKLGARKRYQLEQNEKGTEERGKCRTSELGGAW
jgi:hypothetical protein